MDDIRRQDQRLFLKELLALHRLLGVGGLAALLALLVDQAGMPSTPAWIVFGVAGLWWVSASYKASVRRRFRNPKYKILWDGCRDRLERFHVALKQLRKSQIADLTDLPQTVEGVGQGLYAALRRADTIMHEVSRSEGWLAARAPNPAGPPSRDPQALELYRLADKNLAEYRQHYHAVISGAQRAEAQAAVYMTTLDVLRMRVLGYRLAGRKPDLSTDDFLQSMTEARMQLDAIDKALAEIELTPFPQQITVIPDGPPPYMQVEEDVQQHQEQGR